MKAFLHRKKTGSNNPDEGFSPRCDNEPPRRSSAGSEALTGSSGSRSNLLLRGLTRSRSRVRSSSTLVSVGSIDGEVNGFRAEPDVISLIVQVANVAEHSLPQEVLAYKPPPEAIIARFQCGEIERRVHRHVELSQDELRKLAVMRSLAEAQDKVFTPAVARDASRYLGRAKGDPKRAIRDMFATSEWRREYFAAGPVTDAALQEDLSRGLAYFCGRDRLMRPVLVIRPRRIPPAWYNDKKAAGDRLVKLLVFCMEYMMRYLLVPGAVEGGVAIMDMSGLSISQVPFGTLRSILTILANHYVNRIFRFYLVHLPSALNTTLNFGMRFLTERQRQKLQVIRDVKELQVEFALHQLEEDLGGSRPVVDRCFPFPLLPGPFEAGWSGGPRNSLPKTNEAVDEGATAMFDSAEMAFKAQKSIETAGDSLAPSSSMATASALEAGDVVFGALKSVETGGDSLTSTMASSGSEAPSSGRASIDRASTMATKESAGSDGRRQVAAIAPAAKLSEIGECVVRPATASKTRRTSFFCFKFCAAPAVEAH
mmetsp:Transcript_39447/g.113361  ORF Transcript_39447/g.113361 Transcript_39447/m.113361 type:complete len:540 (+) Transcript_39447:101-1720(+)